MPVIVDGDWYSELCERYTHITPQTKPNFHNDERPLCGGMFQPKGLEKSLGQLVTAITALAMFICKYFKFDDLFKEITAALRGQASECPLNDCTDVAHGHIQK
jgi:hypothetical protein